MNPVYTIQQRLLAGLGAIAFLCPVLGVSRAIATQPPAIAQTNTSFNRLSFVQWCTQVGLSKATQRTINVLLLQAVTTDCNQAQEILNRRADLDLLMVGFAEDLYRYSNWFGSAYEPISDCIHSPAYPT
jgi:hypothetical protein